MLLIDLKKSGIKIPKESLRYFDAEHAALMFGYWLARSTEPHREGKESVRFHQLVSALSAFQLIEETK